MMLILLAVLATAVSAAVEEVIWSIDLPSISYDPIDAWVQQGIEIQWTSTTSGMTGWNELTTTYTLGSPSPSFWFEWSGTGARVNATTRAASSFTNATTIGKLEVDGESLPIVVTGTAGSETWFAVDGLSMDTKHRAVVTLDPPWSAMFAIESVEVLIPVHTKGMFFNDTSMPVNDFTMGNARLDTAHFNFTGDWQAELQINSSFVADSIDKSESYMYIAKGEPGSKVTYALASNSTLMTVQAAFGPEYGDLDIRIEPHPIGGSNLSTVSTNRPKNFQLATVLTAVLDSEVEYIMSVGPSANSTLPVGLVATSVFNYFA
jgi:hypothetical protein